MYFSGNVYCGDKLAALNVLGFYSGGNGQVAGSFVLSVGQDLALGTYTLLTDGGKAQSIMVLSSIGESNQAKLVQFVAVKTVLAAAERVANSVALLR